MSQATSRAESGDVNLGQSKQDGWLIAGVVFAALALVGLVVWIFHKK